MDIESFIIHIKAKDIYKDISEDFEKRFKTSNYEVDRLLPIGKNQKSVRYMKDKLGEQIMKKLVALRPETYSYLNGNDDECKKAKGTNNCAVKRKLKFQDYEKCLKACQIINTVNYLEKKGINIDSLKKDKKKFIKNELLLKPQQKFKSERHNVFTEEIKKITLMMIKEYNQMIQ